MADVAFYISNGFGESIDSPSPDQMRGFLGEIDPADEEHGAAWLSTEDGYSLEWSGDGRLLFNRRDSRAVRHLRNVSRERALELWMALASGRLAEVERCPWQAGNGYVMTPERDEQLREWQLRQDREFYEVLGRERPSIPCRTEGCTRGAIQFSVLCRVHHFESVKKRPCPFQN
jgi:hypothetical protein